MDHLCVFCLVFLILSRLHCCLVVTCWNRADFLALVGDVYCICVTFSCGIQAVYLLDFFCSGIQFYLLLSPNLCFISFL